MAEKQKKISFKKKKENVMRSLTDIERFLQDITKVSKCSSVLKKIAPKHK
ncbi:MAG: hypothetical protein LBL91_00020 [Lachnospiraceae bacterium]|jgi:hypothetical protein|nr:hypothetical protein [Lachnospiraceae bacterium]